MRDVTLLLHQAQAGDEGALRDLIPLVYDQLRTLARQQRRYRASGETVNTTALVHEAYEKLARGSSAAQSHGFADRQHFFRVAARAMREVLVDHARKQNSEKRGGGLQPLALNEALVAAPEMAAPLIALDEALTRLATLNGRQAQVVELRYFVGLTIPETADILGLSHATVERDWTSARAWLHLALAS
ncbi:sigma-70 family RNA polymerase sigma factor [Rubricoccus marinus]|uniref:sigma-70 family RNA polymerase sigma factor n=1 Tax=Rubricoccus marinus TaxID=716817 RepID=UPI001C52E899|nr:sigma-70 family RNA polymerase sigma factor [Rubricoccus marinus]